MCNHGFQQNYVPALVSASAGVAEHYPVELRHLLIEDPHDASELRERLASARNELSRLRQAVRPLSDLGDFDHSELIDRSDRGLDVPLQLSDTPQATQLARDVRIHEPTTHHLALRTSSLNDLDDTIEHVAHRAIVVARLHVADVVAAIVAFLHGGLVVHHA